VTGEISPKSLT